ncbi:MAG TPA: hypothetical protein VHH73_10000, partial [Verrucomicrobiae bacterium]|nr:hypothetical protein [Verrucomicrobiae bacterium]
ISGGPIRRGPEICRTPGDKVDPFADWQSLDGKQPLFDEHTPWCKLPKGFKRQFNFIWRRIDGSAVNPITGDRGDAARAHEFFLPPAERSGGSASGNLTVKDLAHRLQITRLRSDYRLFAIPKGVFTRKAADDLGKWLARSLKQGISHQGEQLGTAKEWTDFLSSEQSDALPDSVGKTTDSHHNVKYLRGLVSLVYPVLEIPGLFAPSPHRAHRKRHVPKRAEIY